MKTFCDKFLFLWDFWGSLVTRLYHFFYSVIQDVILSLFSLSVVKYKNQTHLTVDRPMWTPQQILLLTISFLGVKWLDQRTVLRKALERPLISLYSPSKEPDGLTLFKSSQRLYGGLQILSLDIVPDHFQRDVFCFSPICEPFKHKKRI